MKQRFISTILAFSMIIIASTMHTSCTIRCPKLLLADLLFTVGHITTPQITIGSNFVIKSVLTNLAEECDAEQTVATEIRISAKYKPNQDSAFVDATFSVGGSSVRNEAIVPCPALGSNQSQHRSDSVIFFTPGIYCFNYQADIFDKVIERDETNNSMGSCRAKSINVGQENGKYQLIVEVYDPTGKIKPNYDYQNNPTVLQYLGSK